MRTPREFYHEDLNFFSFFFFNLKDFFFKLFMLHWSMCVCVNLAIRSS